MTTQLDEIRQFLLENVETVAEIDALLFVYRCVGGCTVSHLTSTLGIERRDSARILGHLVARQLLRFQASVGDWTFYFDPSTVQRSRCVKALARLEREDRSKLAELLEANALARAQTKTPQ